MMVSSSDENHNQVAIDLCSASPVDRSLSAAAGGSTTPRSPGFSMVVVPVESPEKTTGKPQTDDHDQQQGRAKEVPLVKKVLRKCTLLKCSMLTPSRNNCIFRI